MNVPRKRIRNRDDIILKYCKWKKVLHVWPCDAPYTKEKYEGKMWPLLYREIDKVCEDQLGIDLDKESIKFLNSKKEFTNSIIEFFDMNKLEWLDYKPDIIVFGEVIEHLMNIEVALTNLKKVMHKNTLLIISTPNAYAFNAVLGNLLWREFFHPDHKVIFTYGILKNMLQFNELETKDFYFCRLPHEHHKVISKILNFFVDIVISKLLPQFYYNLLFVAKLKK